MQIILEIVFSYICMDWFSSAKVRKISVSSRTCRWKSIDEKLLLFSQKNEYENTGDDKRDYCNGGAGRRNIKACRGGVFSWSLGSRFLISHRIKLIEGFNAIFINTPSVYRLWRKEDEKWLIMFFYQIFTLSLHLNKITLTLWKYFSISQLCLLA